MWMSLVEMNVWIRHRSAPFERLGRAVDVAGHDAGERRDHRAADARGDLADGLELALARDRGTPPR